ncbi:hypothetical protein [Paenibacillus lutrae]|uniref:Uncharacterized protein n=1 Tax=Paenibacillus lutrae TaxID=2078573 RepID=A0A7X3FI66_9BACL|nr:hypothetical protein [Paenibacillus lutrae]MVP00133.1 hypothetical protein [Paenibacillus lutrae]
MIIDYHEVHPSEVCLNVTVGVHFEDEPDSYYVIDLYAAEDGLVTDMRLLYNGFPCKYAFKSEEKQAVAAYLNEQKLLTHPLHIPQELSGK